MPHKYIYVESLLREFVDTKFNKKAIKLPLSDFKKINDMWTKVHTDIHVDLERPFAVLSNIIPFKSNPNWVLNRQLKRYLGIEDGVYFHLDNW